MHNVHCAPLGAVHVCTTTTHFLVGHELSTFAVPSSTRFCLCPSSIWIGSGLCSIFDLSTEIFAISSDLPCWLHNCPRSRQTRPRWPPQFFLIIRYHSDRFDPRF